jgi:hypothetical protein
MAENRITQAAAIALTDNANAKARFTQAGVLALTENADAKARLTQVALLVLTDPPPSAVPSFVFCQVVG